MEATTFIAALLGGIIAAILLSPLLEKPIDKLQTRLVRWEEKVKGRFRK